VSVVDDGVGSTALSKKMKSGKKAKGKKSKDPPNFWSLTLVHDALLVDKWTPATKWKEVTWADPSLSNSTIRSPLRTVVERWMDERYGSFQNHWKNENQPNQPWRYEIQVSPSPAHAFFNLWALPVYTFIPAMEGFGVKQIIAFLKAISTKGWFLRTYIHESYGGAALADELKGSDLKIQWVKTVPATMTVEQCKELVAKDRNDHPHLRPFAAIPPFMANAAALFPPADFDTFVVV
jgi:hypothetical protein